jgi:hemerythrin
MPYFEWSSTYSVGIGSFDRHHKHLVGLINKLYEAMHAGKASQELDSLVAGLIEYTQYHFTSEEKLLFQHGYPNYTKHLAEHEAFKAKVTDFQGRLRQGQIGLSVQVANFLKEWLTNHILGEDKKYGPFLLAKGVK